MPTMTTVGCRPILKTQLRVMRVVNATRYAAARRTNTLPRQIVRASCRGRGLAHSNHHAESSSVAVDFGELACDVGHVLRATSPRPVESRGEACSHVNAIAI